VLFRSHFFGCLMLRLKCDTGDSLRHYIVVGE